MKCNLTHKLLLYFNNSIVRSCERSDNVDNSTGATHLASRSSGPRVVRLTRERPQP